MNSSKECIKEMEHSLDPQLWHACAGGMVQMPSINSKVFYFPQGHIEHAQVNIDPKIHPKNLAPFIPCKISAIKYLASQETDEVYVKIRLVPLRGNNFDYDDIELNGVQQIDGSEKPASFAKTLTQSDANNGGGFSVPRYCAETIFPRLDYSVEPPVQTILAKDVHGVTWKFRHIYRGTPRRHLLTTGWSNFVNQKKLVAGDSIVFLRAEIGDLCVGIRRARRGVGDSPESPLGWNGKCGSPYQGYAAFLRDDENKLFRSLNVNGISSCGSSRGNGEMRDENVVEAITLAASDQPFEVVYYPRASTPEFFVKASLVRAALQVQWCTGMRFKMAFETEDSSRISWFMGTVSSVQVADPINWPKSPWRLLQVTWDEPDLLQNVKRVNPWLVELVAIMPQIHMSPFSPPRKKLRLAQGPDFSLIDQLPIPSFSSSTFTPSSPLFGLADKVPTGVQGARHSQFGQFLSDFHTNKQKSSVLANRLDPKFPNGRFLSKLKTTEDLSSFLTVGIPDQGPKKNDTTTAPKFMLFGKPILTEQQILQNSFGDSSGSSTSDGNLERIDCTSDVSNGTLNSSPNERFPSFNSSCKTFIELKEVGQSLGLSSLGSYEDLYKKIAQHAWQGKMRETEQCAL